MNVHRNIPRKYCEFSCSAIEKSKKAWECKYYGTQQLLTLLVSLGPDLSLLVHPLGS